MRVLSVTHGPTVGGGVFEQVVEEAGHELERWLVPEREHDADAEAYDAVMVFGGAMHPDQDARHPWMPGEAEFLRRALDAKVPLLGVCLGAQLIARAAGAEVGPSPEPEVGWLPVELNDAGRADPVLSALPDRVDAFQWHSYTFELPAGAALLAQSRCCRQAFSLDGHAWGIQFHAEVTAAMIDAWIEEDPEELPMPPDELRAQTAARIEGWNASGRALVTAFLAAAGA
jgi:GMP synthase-like glutamine amidotransferase